MKAKKAICVVTALIFFYITLATPLWGDIKSADEAIQGNDYAAAIEEFLILADQENIEAHFRLAALFTADTIGETVQGLKWLRVAAEHGHMYAQMSMAKAYISGIGVPQDYVMAHLWFSLTASQGHKDSSNVLDYLNKIMTSEQITEAKRLARDWKPKKVEGIRPETGDAYGQFGRGLRYEQSRGVPKDFKRALYWYKRAAKQGLVFAQIRLGEMYRLGKGVPMDYVKAHMWFNLAGAQGHKKWHFSARRYCHELSEKMTPQQIAEAQRLASKWKPN